MSLATRCTACGTVFRVVQDQLKVSEGWVRCGRCNEVFSALEGLFDLDRDTPPDWPASTFGQALRPAARTETAFGPGAGDSRFAAEADATSPQGDDGSSTDAIDKIDAQLTRPRESSQRSTPATRVNERDRLEFPDAQFDPNMLAEDAAEPSMPATGPLISDDPIATTQPVAPPAAPDFVQRAQRQARWGSPRMRALQAATVTVLLTVLGLQGAHQFRDEIAARWPHANPLLGSWCEAMNCTIAAPRRIEDVAVESTALTRAPVPDAFRLSVVLRNRGTVAVALPSVDLSLTDAAGQLVSRRMLAPRDFGAAPAPMRPGGESALQLVLSTGGARVAGYTVEVFYP